MGESLKQYLLVVIFSFLAMPLIFMALPVNDRELHGVTEPVKKPGCSLQAWTNGNYQKQFEPYFTFNLGLRKAAVRTASQLHYALGVQRNEVIVGADNELMGKEYIDAYYGRDFIGVDSIKKVVTGIKQFQQELNKKGIVFFVVIAPNKSRLYANKTPAQFKGEETQLTNYNYLVKGFKDVGVPFINFEEWFESIDKNSPYPLYSNLGVHWSYYAATFCADSIAGYISALTKQKINRIIYKDVVTTTAAYDTDKDLAELMNLWWPMEVNRPLAYFKTEFVRDSAALVPQVLTVGDSYYWNIIYTGMPKNYFGEGSVYFYYNQTAYYNNGAQQPVKNIDVTSAILNKQVVFFLYSEPNLRQIGNGIDVAFLNALKTDTLQ